MWRLTAKKVEDGEIVEFQYFEEFYARKGEEAMGKGGFEDVVLEEVHNG
jgi:hypothetical protein